jgi:Chaperone of endosialidase
MKLIKYRRSPAIILGLLALFIALGGAGIAATGDNFILGQSNSADKTTALSSPIASDKALELSNTSTTSGATALGLTVASGHAPLTVSSGAGKATNLNADMLDGLDSTSFWKMSGNAGTTPGTNFLGTTDDTALELKVSGSRALRIEPCEPCAENGMTPNLVGGWFENSVATAGATIGGGGGRGYRNSVTAWFGTIAGGRGNKATYQATVGGGLQNDARGDSSTIAGGGSNSAIGPLSAVGGGNGNTARGGYSTIPGGVGNGAKGNFAAVPGGQTNHADGDFSLAAGRRAIASYAGSFVWADSHDFNVYANGTDTFTARTTGGARFISAIDASTGSPTAGVKLAAGSGSWSSLSDRNAKERFTPVNEQALLKQLDRVPITRWGYKAQGSSIRHLGPTAQDFRAAFGLGEDNRHIDTIDSEGVALAAIQGLYRQNKALQRENRGLHAQLQEQKARLTRLERAFSTLSR